MFSVFGRVSLSLHEATRILNRGPEAIKSNPEVASFPAGRLQLSRIT